MKSLVTLAVCAIFALSFSGCSLLGCADTEPVLELRSPIGFGAKTMGATLPRGRQMAVFAAPVQPSVASFGYPAEACPAPAPAPAPVEPLFGAKRGYLEK
jgi:hypothetical protein